MPGNRIDSLQMGSMKETEEETQLADNEMSDLAGAWVTLWIVAWFAAILVAFFFIGPALLFVRFIRRSDLS